MKIDILTLFPEMFDNVFNESIIKRAKDKNLVNINIHNFRDNSPLNNIRYYYIYLEKYCNKKELISSPFYFQWCLNLTCIQKNL